MNSNDIKMILDKTDINVLDEINILEYIDELEQTKEEYIKSLDKLDVLETRIDKAIEYIETHQLNFKKGTTTFGSERLSMEERKLLDTLRGEE